MSKNRPRQAYKFFQGFGDEPKLEEFGITTDEYTKLKQGADPWTTPRNIIVVIIAIIVGVVSGSAYEDLKAGVGFGFGTLVVLGITAYLITEAFKRSHPIYHKVRLYQEALENFYRKQEQYWMSLKGEGLEYRVADLYRKLGYKVEDTSRTDDKGIDLILKRSNITTVVQCKGHKNPVGPAIVRELYGTLKSYGAENAILVSPAGFTRGAKQTAAGHNIQLISSQELIAIAEELE